MSENPSLHHELSSTRQLYGDSYAEKRPSKFSYIQNEHGSSDDDVSSWNPSDTGHDVMLTGSRPYDDGLPYAVPHIGGDFPESLQYQDHSIGNYITASNSVEDEHVALDVMKEFVRNDASLYEPNPQPQTPASTQRSLGLPDEQLVHHDPGLVQQYASLRAPSSAPNPPERIGDRLLNTESIQAHPRQHHQLRNRQTDDIQRVSSPSSSSAIVRSQENSQRIMNGQSGLTHVSENESTPGRFVLFDPNQYGESSAVRERSKKKRNSLDEQNRITKKRRTSVCQRCKKNKEACEPWDPTPTSRKPCTRCSSMSPWKYLCFPAKIKDKGPWKESGLLSILSSPLYKNLQSWTAGDQQSLEVSNGYSETFTVEVNKYVPINPALLENRMIWNQGGGAISFELSPCLALGIQVENDTNILFRRLSGSLSSYIDLLIPLLLEDCLRDAGINQAYMRTVLCVQEVSRKPSGEQPNEPQLIHKALRIWAAQIVLFRDQWRTIPQNDQSGFQRATPLPALLHAQLNSAMEQQLVEWDKAFLSSLNSVLLKALCEPKNPSDGELSSSAARKKYWMDTYLSIFMYLSALEGYCWALKTWKVDISGRSASFPSVAPDDLQNVLVRAEYLADTLMSYNRSAYFKGYVPFEQSSDSRCVLEQEGASLDFIKSMQDSVQDQTVKADLVSRMNAEYRPETIDSLKMKFTSKLLLSYEDYLEGLKDTGSAMST